MPQTEGISEITYQLVNKGALFLVGAGASHELGYPTGPGLAFALCRDFGISEKEPTLESVVARLIHEKGIGRETIARRARDIIASREGAVVGRYGPSNPYCLLASILTEILRSRRKSHDSPRFSIVTTNYDCEIELALRDRIPDEVRTVLTPEDITKDGQRPISVYKLHGDVGGNSNTWGKIALTQSDFDTLRNEREALYVDLKSAAQNFPLIVVGQSFSDQDLKVAYEEVTRNVGKHPTYFVDPFLERVPEGAQLVRQSSRDFFLAVAECLAREYDISALHNIEFLGIRLSIDDALEAALKDADGRLVVLVGPRLQGKTLAVRRAGARDRIPRGYRHIEVPKSPLDRSSIKRLCESVTGQILEVTPWQLQWYLKDAATETGSTGYTSKVGRLGGLLKEWFLDPDKTEETSANPLVSCLEVHAKLIRPDVDALFDVFAKGALSKASNPPAAWTAELASKRAAIISLASWGGPPGDTVGEGGTLIVPLLERIVREHGGKQKADLERLQELDKEREKFVGGFLAIGLGEAAGMGAALAQAMNLIATPLAVSLPLVGVVLVGLSSTVAWYKKGRESGFAPFITLYKSWNDMAFEKREYISELLDERHKLPPGSSFEFLSGWLSRTSNDVIEDEQHFRKRLDQLFPETTREEVQRIVDAFPQFQAKVESLRNYLDSSIVELTAILKGTEAKLAVVEKSVIEVKERLAGVEFRATIGLPILSEIKDPNQLEQYYRVTSSVLPLRRQLHLRSGEGVSEVTYNQLLRSLDRWDGKKWVYVIVGESGIGKSWFAYQLSRDLMLSDNGHTVYSLGSAGEAVTSAPHPPIESGHIRDKEGFPVFILDDGRIVNFANTRVWLEGLLERGEPEGPIIVSAASTDWVKLRRLLSLEVSGKHDLEESLEERIQEIQLDPLPREQMRVILETLIAETSVKPEESSSRAILDELLSRANGVPALLRLFFSSLPPTKKEISLGDVRESGTDPYFYTLRKLVHIYFLDGRVRENNTVTVSRSDLARDHTLREDIVATLSALYMLAMRDTAVGQLYLPAVNEDGEAARMAAALQPPGSESPKAPEDIHFPLFSVDKRGLVSPVHGVVARVIRDIVEGHLMTRAGPPGRNRGSVSEFVKVLDLVRQDVTKRAESVRSPEADGHLFENFYRLAAESSAWDNSEKLLFSFNLLSLWLVADGSLASVAKLGKHFGLLKTVLAESCGTTGDTSLVVQKYYVIDRYELWDNAELWPCVVDFLQMDDHILRRNAWIRVLGLMNRGKVASDALRPLKGCYLELLESGDDFVCRYAWIRVVSLLSAGIVSNEDLRPLMDHYLVFLKSGSDFTRVDAWGKAVHLLDTGIVNDSDLARLKSYLLDLLKSRHRSVSMVALAKAVYLLGKGVVSDDDLDLSRYGRGEMSEYKSHFTKMHAAIRAGDGLEARSSTLVDGDRSALAEYLKSRYGFFCLDAWVRADDALNRESVTPEESRVLLLALLQSEDEFVCRDAWLRVGEMLDRKLVASEDLVLVRNHLFRLLKSEDEFIRRDAWVTAVQLKDRGMIEGSDLKSQMDSLAQLMESHDVFIRRDARLTNALLVEEKMDRQAASTVQTGTTVPTPSTQLR